MGAYLRICKTKKENIVNNKLIINNLYECIGEIDCSYSQMDCFCKGENIIELVDRKEYNDSIYHITDINCLDNINGFLGQLDYDKESEIIIVEYDNA